MSEAGVDYLGGPSETSVAAHDGRAEYDYDVSACYYCGEPASTVDHVVPKSMLQTLRTLGDDDVNAVLVRFGRRLTVPSCSECNAVLSNSYQDTLAKRKAELKSRLRRRHKRILETPDWSDRELSQLGARMQEYVIGAIVKRDIVLRRLRY